MNIVDKIKKLIKHEQSARKIGSIDEANKFAGKIQQLCIDHKISLASVESDDDVNASQRIGHEEATSGSRLRYARNARVPAEDNRLMQVVAKAHFCQALLVQHSNAIIVIGAQDDRAIAVAMFRFLSRTMKSLARLEKEKCRKARRSIRRFQPHFYWGLTVTVRKRYEEIRRKAESESTALVLVRADQLVKQYMESNFETESATHRKQPRINKTAYFAGVMHGGRVDLSTKVIEG